MARRKSKAAQFAQKRNFAKYRLEGIRSSLRAVLKSSILLATEQIEIEMSLAAVEDCLKTWNAFYEDAKEDNMGV